MPVEHVAAGALPAQDLLMLVVKVEVWPGGDASFAREVGRAGFANVTALADVSDYVCVIADELDGDAYLVRGHERARGFWELVRRALTDAESVPNEQLGIASAIAERLEL